MDLSTISVQVPIYIYSNFNIFYVSVAKLYSIINFPILTFELKILPKILSCKVKFFFYFIKFQLFHFHFYFKKPKALNSMFNIVGLHLIGIQYL